MQITVTIKDKDLKQWVTELADYTLDNYDDQTRKIAKAPSVATLTKQIMADEKYMAALQKKIAKTMQDNADEFLIDDVMDTYCPTVNALEVVLGKAQEEARKKEEAQRQLMKQLAESEAEAAMVNRMVAALKKAGYKVEKS